MTVFQPNQPVLWRKSEVTFVSSDGDQGRIKFRGDDGEDTFLTVPLAELSALPDDDSAPAPLPLSNTLERGPGGEVDDPSIDLFAAFGVIEAAYKAHVAAAPAEVPESEPAPLPPANTSASGQGEVDLPWNVWLRAHRVVSKTLVQDIARPEQRTVADLALDELLNDGWIVQHEQVIDDGLLRRYIRLHRFVKPDDKPLEAQPAQAQPAAASTPPRQRIIHRPPPTQPTPLDARRFPITSRVMAEGKDRTLDAMDDDVRRAARDAYVSAMAAYRPPQSRPFSLPSAQ